MIARPDPRNPFGLEAAADRYARGRVPFHPAVLERVRDLPGVAGGMGLDVGCGTGLSSRALAAVCRRVVALDLSPMMLSRFALVSGVDRVAARGERLPLRDHRVHVVTVSQAMHWLDVPAFLGEARRVLRPGAWVVAYDHFFAPDADGAFARWLRGPWLERFPPAGRWPVELGSFVLWAGGRFELQRFDRLRTSQTWSVARFVDYLLSQSSIAAAEERGESMADARAWIEEAVHPLFAGSSTRDFAFESPIACAQAPA